MSVPQPVLIAFVLCLGAAGCQRAAPPDATGAASTAQRGPAATATTSDMPVSYRCADGSSLEVVYAGGKAEVRWPDGRRLTLPRAESASKGGGDVYVGDTVSLQHDGLELQLHDGERPAQACEQS